MKIADITPTTRVLTLEVTEHELRVIEEALFRASDVASGEANDMNVHDEIYDYMQGNGITVL